MSKAFTSEETPDAGPLVRAPPKLQPGEVRYVTPEGYADLKDALAKLREQRTEPPDEALSEAEQAAKDSEREQRAQLLEATLATLTVLGPEQVPEGRVGFGTWVTVEDEEGVEMTWRIVGPEEADPRRGQISVHSPIARALVGREEGDTVEVKKPSGTAELSILSVSRFPPVVGAQDEASP